LFVVSVTGVDVQRLQVLPMSSTIELIVTPVDHRTESTSVLPLRAGSGSLTHILERIPVLPAAGVCAAAVVPGAPVLGVWTWLTSVGVLGTEGAGPV